MQDIVVRVEEDQRELRAALKEISRKLHRIDVELASVKSRLTVLSAGGAAIFGGMIWALQYFLTK